MNILERNDGNRSWLQIERKIRRKSNALKRWLNKFEDNE